MGLSKERKIFAGLLGLAGAALVLDQGFLQPRSASAGGPGLLVSAAESLVVKAAGGEPDGAGKSGPLGMAPALIASRLRLGGTADGDLGNAFALPPDWVAKIGLQPEGTASQPSAVKDELVLSAVMPTGSGGIAVINGSPVRVGDEIGSSGYRLVRVAAQSAFLEGHGAARRLDLPIPTSGGR